MHELGRLRDVKKGKGIFETVAEALRSVERSTVRKRRARERHAAEVAARVPGEGYEPCIVSFIDVLGFRTLLERVMLTTFAMCCCNCGRSPHRSKNSQPAE